MITLKRKRIHYLYFMENRLSEKVEKEFLDFEGISILKVKIPIIKERDTFGRIVSINLDAYIWKKVKQIMKCYLSEGIVIGAQDDVAKALEIDDIIFDARKQELLSNVKWIMRQLRQEVTEVSGYTPLKRYKRLLLITDETCFNSVELTSFLLTAKDYYEELFLATTEVTDVHKFVANELYEQWGILLHFVDLMQMVEVDTVFLARNFGCNKEERMETAQLQEEQIKEIVRYKNMYTLTPLTLLSKNVYMGILYEIKEKEVPYYFATNCTYQNQSLCQEFAWNSVAICHMKC